jgi:hypothetical protein
MGGYHQVVWWNGRASSVVWWNGRASSVVWWNGRASSGSIVEWEGIISSMVENGRIVRQ